MPNEAMQAAWDGDEGEHWAAHAAVYDAVSARVMAAYVPGIAVRPGDRVLDIGCGAGKLALALAPRCPEGSVLGIDLSSQMLEVATGRAVANGFANVEFTRADAQVHPFAEASFDLAVSSFGVMFFDDPVAAFGNIARALRPGGHVSFLVWRAMQDNALMMGIRNALALGRDLPFPPLHVPSPFALSNPERTESLFTEAGFVDVEFQPVDEPMALGNVAAAFDFVSGMGLPRGLSQDLDEAQKAQGFTNLRQFLADHDTPDGVLVDTATWIITAHKP